MYFKRTACDGHFSLLRTVRQSSSVIVSSQTKLDSQYHILMKRFLVCVFLKFPFSLYTNAEHQSYEKLWSCIVLGSLTNVVPWTVKLALSHTARALCFAAEERKYDCDI